MKALGELRRNIGLIVLLGGVAYLVYIVYTGVQTNTTLGISTAAILLGFILYITLNRR